MASDTQSMALQGQDFGHAEHAKHPKHAPQQPTAWATTWNDAQEPNDVHMRGSSEVRFSSLHQPIFLSINFPLLNTYPPPPT